MGGIRPIYEHKWLGHGSKITQQLTQIFKIQIIVRIKPILLLMSFLSFLRFAYDHQVLKVHIVLETGLWHIICMFEVLKVELILDWKS